MKKPTSGVPTAVEGKARPPVRVKLKRINANHAQAYPPNGQGREWWDRLKNAFGTASSDFVNTALFQLMAAARLPGGGLSETAVNAALAMIESAKPQNELEGALLIQIACTHTAAMAVTARIGGGHGSDRNLAAKSAAASRLLRAFAFQLKTLRHLRGGGNQYVRVEHVHITDGGQAVIGNVATPFRTVHLKSDSNSPDL